MSSSGNPTSASSGESRAERRYRKALELSWEIKGYFKYPPKVAIQHIVTDLKGERGRKTKDREILSDARFQTIVIDGLTTIKNTMPGDILVNVLLMLSRDLQADWFYVNESQLALVAEFLITEFGQPEEKK